LFALIALPRGKRAKATMASNLLEKASLALTKCAETLGLNVFEGLIDFIYIVICDNDLCHSDSTFFLNAENQSEKANHT
jgi:hypothetical protein